MRVQRGTTKEELGCKSLAEFCLFMRELDVKCRKSITEGRFGGRDRDRTCDLMLAKHALSQLSYTPTILAILVQFRR